VLSPTRPKGDPLVLLPGMNCSARLWSFLDLGSATCPTLTEPTLGGQVDRLLDELPPRFALGGLSLGAIVAMALVRRAPERVRWLGLMSTNPYAPTAAQYAGWAAQRSALAGGKTARELQSELLPVLLSPRVVNDRPDLVEQTLVMADDVGSTALDAQLAMQVTRVDARAGLAKVRCPTVIIAARDDALCPVDRHRELHRLIPGSQLLIIDECAHLSPLEQPALISRAVNQD
jgi:pimeloyl-ACP methyl ester carboxylesterase